MMSIAPYCRIDNAKAKAILAEVERALSLWRAAGRRIGMSTVELDEFAAAFESNERAVARRIVKTGGLVKRRQ